MLVAIPGLVSAKISHQVQFIALIREPEPSRNIQGLPHKATTSFQPYHMRSKQKQNRKESDATFTKVAKRGTLL